MIQGGTLTDPHPFATDPLEGFDDLIEQRRLWYLQEVPCGYDYENFLCF